MITILAAIGLHNELGKDNDLLWSIPEDMQFFKTYTTGKTVVMGRKTYESIGRPLPNRKNIVVSSTNIVGVPTYPSLELVLAHVDPDVEVVIIGGGMLYQAALELDIVDKMLITKVDNSYEDADVFFPKIDESIWEVVKSEISCNGILSYMFVEYSRREL